MDHAGTLRRVHAIEKHLALHLQPLGTQQVRGAHRIDHLVRGDLVGLFFLQHGGSVVQRLVVLGRVQIAGAAGLQFAVQHFLRRSQRHVARCAIFQPVDQAFFQRFLRGHHPARQRHVQRHRDTGQARHALRAASARQQAKVDFRQADAQPGDADPRVRGQAQLQPATQRGAVHHGDHGNFAVFDHVEHIGQRGRLGRLAEFLDIGARHEGAPGSIDRDDLGRALGVQLFDGVLQPLAHSLPRGVHGRVVDADQGNIALVLDGNKIIDLTRLGHALPPVSMWLGPPVQPSFRWKT